MLASKGHDIMIENKVLSGMFTLNVIDTNRTHNIIIIDTTHISGFK